MAAGVGKLVKKNSRLFKWWSIEAVLWLIFIIIIYAIKNFKYLVKATSYIWINEIVDKTSSDKNINFAYLGLTAFTFIVNIFMHMSTYKTCRSCYKKEHRVSLKLCLKKEKRYLVLSLLTSIVPGVIGATVFAIISLIFKGLLCKTSRELKKIYRE